MAPPRRSGAYKEVTLQQLRSFCETARLGSFKAAADSLGLAHPTIWEQVHALERELSAQLVEPHGRGCRLTEEGHLLAEMADSLVAGIDSLKRRFQEARGRVRSRLTVAATQRTLIEDLSEAILAFERCHPNVQLCFKEENNEQVVAAVESGQADLGVTPFPEPRPPNPWLVFELGYELDLILLTPPDHPLARRRHLRPRDLLPYPLINAPGSLPDPAMNALLEKLGAFETPPRRVEARYTATIRHFVAMGFGIGLTVGLPGRAPVSQLHERSLSRHLGRLRMNLVWRRGTQRQGAAQEFAETIRRQPTTRLR
jgi:DNA-binding transcriptional LysR family regulator